MEKKNSPNKKTQFKLLVFDLKNNCIPIIFKIKNIHQVIPKKTKTFRGKINRKDSRIRIKHEICY